VYLVLAFTLSCICNFLMIKLSYWHFFLVLLVGVVLRVIGLPSTQADKIHIINKTV